jgi:calcium/calmodulin-dependent protein kinase (CaM kinase) II/calcium-dependent protein kinase
LQYTLGEVLGKLLFGLKLGEGAHAVVKEGWSKKGTKSKVAVKVFRSGDPEIVNTIKRTYNNTRFLNHSCLIRELELFINEKTETSFLVMEFC